MKFATCTRHCSSSRDTLPSIPRPNLLVESPSVSDPVPDTAQLESSTVRIESSKVSRNFPPRSVQASDTQRELKDLQYMDQSLRTVATQLLNASSPEDPGKILESNIIKKPIAIQKPVERNDVTPMKELTVMNGQPIGFGRPINSKFSYFESSHPGQAMAITEEELEREMSSTRLMTAYKNHPTTTGGISTWILLNPPSTTIKTIEMEKRTKPAPETEVRVTVKPTTLMERVETTERVAEKVTMPVSTTMAVEEAPSTRRTVLVTTKKTTDSKPEKVEGLENLEPVPQNTTFKLAQTTESMLESKEAFAGTTKKVQILRTTPKPKTATTKTTLLSKPSISKTSRPNHLARPKPPIRRTTVKPDIAKNENASTAKIEKVTFRPVQMVTVSKNKPESTEKPMFVTKIKASIMMGTQKTTTPAPSSPTTNVEAATTMKSIFNNELTEVKTKPVATKASNVLKMQLKKPLDDATNIEIQSIKVNAPVLKIEKVEEKDSLDSSKIDLKFDFNRELTKVNVDTEESVSTTSAITPTSTSTTKRPRHTSKRKKNKVRRRKPSTSTTTTTGAPVTASSTELELLAEESENDVQESKIAPETKLTANSTKMKKKPPQKPISTQIYNFLSREVMPSFGVMSLVGLGLGLASYFFYPFGGAIARRNYEVEPKYKYNLDEYGGNYGQSEEEVLSKVLQGMTSDEVNYAGNKDYDSNYYRYQNHDGGYEPHTTKKNEQRYPSSSPIYTASSFKYKNTDHRYPDAPSTPNYYDRPKPSAYVVGQSVPGSANRQFVVGNVPKDYSPYEEKVPALSTPGKLANSYEPTESGQAEFDRDAGQSFSLPGGPVQGSVQGYGQIQTVRPEDGYEEVEITPAAVAVEHGPRSLRTKRSVDSMGSLAVKPSYLRWKRDSVIQVIPSKRELEEEEKEENLSNEILNIIDSALPGEDGEKTKDRRKDNEVEDFEVQRRRQKEEEKTRLKEATMKTPTAETTTASTTLSTASSPAEPASSSTERLTDSVASSSAATEVEGNTTESSKDTEESNVEWIDPTTGKPPEQNGFNLFNFVKKIAEIKFRLGLTILKHASEGFARYIGHVQKRINGEE